MADAIQAPANAEGPTSHTQNQVDGLRKLREPFPRAQINPLPKITCGKCSKSPMKECDNHRKGKCRECDNWITSAHMHLDYVGHAELTNRLLDADPLWDWEPMAVDDTGLPKFDGFGGLWIRLTVCGHSRLGYGDSQGKSGPNAVKEAIGDALRNAAMRFGAALDLWAKSDLREAQAEHPKTADEDVPARVAQPQPEHARPAEAAPETDPVQDALLDKLMRRAVENRLNVEELAKVRAEAEAKKVIDRQVQGPPPERAWMPFHQLLDLLMEGAKAAQRGEHQRSAA